MATCFFKRILPKGEVVALRADMLGVVEKYGWRDKGQEALGGGDRCGCLEPSSGGDDAHRHRRQY